MSDRIKNVGLFNKAVTKGNSTKDDMMMTKQADLMDMKRSLVVAPLCLSAMGQLCLIAASANDIDLTKTEDEGPTLEVFNYLRTPQSYRGSLLQVVQATYWAFMQSQTSMQKIQIECGMVSGHLKDGLKILFMGTHKDVEQFLPNNLRRISNIAEDCAEEGKKVVDAFKNVTLIIHELQLASVAKIGDTEKVEKIVKADMEQTILEKVAFEEMKVITAARLKKLNKEVEENGKALKEAVDNMPDAGLLIGAAFTDAAIGLIKAVPVLSLVSMVNTGLKIWKETEGEGDYLEIVRKSEEKRDATLSIVVELRTLTGMLPKMQSIFNDEGTLNAQKIETIDVPRLMKTFKGMKSRVASYGANAELSKLVLNYIDDLIQICNDANGDDPEAVQRWKLDSNKLKDKAGLWKSVDSWIFKTKDDDMIFIENTSKTKVLGTTSDGKVIQEFLVEGKADQLWKKGKPDAEGYFSLQNSVEPKVLTAISKSSLEIKDPEATLFDRFNNVQTEIENTSSASAGLTQDMPFNKEGPPMRSLLQNAASSNDDNLSSKLIKSASIKLEVARVQLDKATERADLAFERDMKFAKKIKERIRLLAEFKAAEATLEEILEVLKVGLQTMNEIQKNWSKLLTYFETIKNLLDVTLGHPLAQFVEDGKVLGDNRASGETLSKIQRELIYKPAYEASSVSYMVELLAGTYAEISQVHLMPLLDKVSGLFSLIGPENKKKVQQKKLEIQNEGHKAVQAIEEIINSNKREYEESIDARKKVLEDTFNKYIPELTEADKAEVSKVIESVKLMDLTNEELEEFA